MNLSSRQSCRPIPGEGVDEWLHAALNVTGPCLLSVSGRLGTLFSMRNQPPYLILAITLVAVMCGAGCWSHRPVTTALHWMPETLRPVYDPGPGFYCYAPSVIQGDKANYVFACRNREPFVIRDHIYAFRQERGAVSAPTVVLAPSHEPASWDSFHICDPSVIAGRFRDGGTIYRYAMFYLGNDVDASRNNQIGVAFSKRLEGPWKRYGPPIVPDSQRGTWGTGQPSAVSLDHKGRVLLFYTVGHYGAAGYVRELDLSDVTNPVIGEETQLSNQGLTRTDGGQDWLNNFDVALDRKRRRFLVVRERHPYPASQPDFIGEQVQVVSLAAGDLRRPDAVWKVEGEITPALTGFARNHNAGIVRNAFGELPDSDRLRVCFSPSQAEPALHGQFAVWTYTLHEVSAQRIEEPAS